MASRVQDYIDAGYVQQPDGSWLNPQDGSRLLSPTISDADYTRVNDAAAAGQTYATSHPNDPLAAFGYDIKNDPTDYALPEGMEFNDQGELTNKQGFWEKYGPWVALAAAGGVEALPFLAGGGAAAAGGSGAAEAGAAGGVLPSTAIGTGMVPGIAGGAGLGGGAGAAGAVGAGTAGAVLPSTAIGTGDMAPIAGGAGFADTSGSAGVLGSIGKYAKALSGVGGAISSATDAAAKQRIAQNDPYVQRGKLEMAERNQDLKDVYLADAAQHPVHSPFDPVAPTMPSGDYAATLKNLSSQGTTALSKAPAYDVTSFPSLQPGTLATIGQWAGPILKTIGSLPGLFKS